jgi:hypothetical protein
MQNHIICHIAAKWHIIILEAHNFPSPAEEVAAWYLKSNFTIAGTP